eukprot:3133253-Amphidinium_carterae.1
MEDCGQGRDSSYRHQMSSSTGGYHTASGTLEEVALTQSVHLNVLVVLQAKNNLEHRKQTKVCQPSERSTSPK